MAASPQYISSRHPSDASPKHTLCSNSAAPQQEENVARLQHALQRATSTVDGEHLSAVVTLLRGGRKMRAATSARCCRAGGRSASTSYRCTSNYTLYCTPRTASHPSLGKRQCSKRACPCKRTS
jgi:hypothetical protein